MKAMTRWLRPSNSDNVLTIDTSLQHFLIRLLVCLQGVEVERLSEGDGKNYPKAGDTVQMVR